MILPPHGTRYSIAHINKDTYFVEFYRLAGSRWISVAHCVCEGQLEVETWLQKQFAPLLVGVKEV